MKKMLLATLPLLALSAAPASADDNNSHGNFGAAGLLGLTGMLGGSFEGFQAGGAWVNGSSLVAGGTIGDRMGSMSASQVSSETLGNATSAVTGFINPGTMQFGGNAQTSFSASSGGFGSSNLGGLNSFVAGTTGAGLAGTTGTLGLTGMIQLAPFGTR